jgi:hypothetical protein
MIRNAHAGAPKRWEIHSFDDYVSGISYHDLPQFVVAAIAMSINNLIIDWLFMVMMSYGDDLLPIFLRDYRFIVAISKAHSIHLHFLYNSIDIQINFANLCRFLCQWQRSCPICACWLKFQFNLTILQLVFLTYRVSRTAHSDNHWFKHV